MHENKTILGHCFSCGRRLSTSVEHEEVDRCVHNDTLTCCSSATAVSPLSCGDHIIACSCCEILARSIVGAIAKSELELAVVACFRNCRMWQARTHESKSALSHTIIGDKLMGLDIPYCMTQSGLSGQVGKGGVV
ncbi:uncharacterized protein LAESUDRAFT_307724 [Laetiporus sulphureus 93-53]|uniref:Uncharacterized protein n=1 Tax=Laetiporus sulphureus 93-53 TaxID=1314785 RepID=A0A165D9L0_9APHY|nr:uncharacterized protein LAESUDRAFT_307724 [Laetiporus sulphureus 93-53]KZT04387.1 hypothetical protein LAESUDRAFT_307724 [Laetiporus sulphureus 93-53]